MDVRFNLDSNIAARAEADRAAVKALRAELEAAGASTDKLADAGAKAADKAKPFSSSSWADKDALKFAQEMHSARGKFAEDTAKREEKASEKAAQAREKAADKAKSKAREGAEMAFGVAAGAAGISGLASLGKLAMGYQGMARLQALGFRTEVQMRQLFRGVDSAPAVRAADRFLNSIFSKSSATGKALSGMFERGFGGFFAMLERNQPLITSFFQGAIIAGLKLEETYYVLAEAALPFTSAVESTIGPLGELKIAATGGQVAVAGLALAATGGAAPFVAAAAAVGLFVEQVVKLKKEWGEWKEGKRLIGNKLRGDLGFETQEEFDAKRRTPGEGESGAGGDAEVARINAERQRLIAAQREAGADSGEAYAAGVMKGVKGGADAAGAAGRDLAGAVDKGFRVGAEIHSPSKKAERTAENVPAGTVRGIENGIPDVQAAANRMAPVMPGVGSSGRGATGGGLARLELNVNVTVQGGGSVADEGPMRVIAQRVFGEECRAALMSLGIAVTS